MRGYTQLTQEERYQIYILKKAGIFYTELPKIPGAICPGNSCAVTNWRLTGTIGTRSEDLLRRSVTSEGDHPCRVA